MSPDSVLHMLHRVLKRAGLPKVRFHDLRHTFATLALQNGVDIKTVSGMLGHFSAGFTLDTYAHVTTSAKREAAKTMGNILWCGIVLSAIRSRWGQRLGQKKWQVRYWIQKCGKSPDFARNQDFLVAETGLEPATSGL